MQEELHFDVDCIIGQWKRNKNSQNNVYHLELLYCLQKNTKPFSPLAIKIVLYNRVVHRSGGSGLSRQSIHICTCFAAIVALRETAKILTVPQAQLAVSKDAVGRLSDTEHEGRRRGGVTCQSVFSSIVDC